MRKRKPSLFLAGTSYGRSNLGENIRLCANQSSLVRRRRRTDESIVQRRPGERHCIGASPQVQHAGDASASTAASHAAPYEPGCADGLSDTPADDDQVVRAARPGHYQHYSKQHYGKQHCRKCACDKQCCSTPPRFVRRLAVRSMGAVPDSHCRATRCQCGAGQEWPFCAAAVPHAAASNPSSRWARGRPAAGSA